QQHQQQRIRLQAITQQQLGRFRQVQATRELCDQDADLAAQLGRRWADDGNDHGGDNHERGGVQPAVTDDADNSLEAREAALISQRRQLENRLSRLAEEADRLRRRCGNGGVGSGGGDFTLARRMQDAEAQLAQVMSETELADSSLARCIAELDECRWRLRRSERRHRRSRRRHRRHRRRREEEEEDADARRRKRPTTNVNKDRAASMPGCKLAGLATKTAATQLMRSFICSAASSGGLPVVAPGSPIYDNPSNSAPFAAGGDGGGGHPLALAAAPSRYAHSRQSLRQAVTASATAAGPVPAVNGAAGIEERPLQSRVTHYQQQQQQQPLPSTSASETTAATRVCLLFCRQSFDVV
uniref:CUPID domain-containing protein n=1 Tax=Macrostomum lignano TaxID=282301 RepID=A0A1I8IVC3_9PLAT